MRLSLLLLIVSAVGFGVGIGWWVHPGAGLAVGSIALGCIALFRDFEVTPAPRRRRR